VLRALFTVAGFTAPFDLNNNPEADELDIPTTTSPAICGCAIVDVEDIRACG
jgi:hypothetical protein